MEGQRRRENDLMGPRQAVEPQSVCGRSEGVTTPPGPESLTPR